MWANTFIDSKWRNGHRTPDFYSTLFRDCSVISMLCSNNTTRKSKVWFLYFTWFLSLSAIIVDDEYALNWVHHDIEHILFPVSTNRHRNNKSTACAMKKLCKTVNKRTKRHHDKPTIMVRSRKLTIGASCYGQQRFNNAELKEKHLPCALNSISLKL